MTYMYLLAIHGSIQTFSAVNRHTAPANTQATLVIRNLAFACPIALSVMCALGWPQHTSL